MLKSQDVLVWLRVFIWNDEQWTIASVAHATGLSASEVHAALARLALSRLYDASQKKPMVSNMEEFLVFGFKYVFPPEYQGLDRGLPTGVGGPVLAKKFSSLAGELPVWACVAGTVRGQVLKPLHPKVPAVALKDPQWYAIVSLLDVIRGGKVREQREAVQRLRNFLHRKESFAGEPSKH